MTKYKPVSPSWWKSLLRWLAERKNYRGTTATKYLKTQKNDGAFLFLSAED